MSTRIQSLAERLSIAEAIQANIVGDVDDPTIPWDVSRLQPDLSELAVTTQRFVFEYKKGKQDYRTLFTIAAMLVPLFILTIR